jgi:hypothetical protein
MMLNRRTYGFIDEESEQGRTWQPMIASGFQHSQKLAMVLAMASMWVFPGWARAQSPELSMREFSSGQIKKGVRSIGFGGDGATWGNYALVWKDADTVLADYGDTHYTNGNDFHFSAIGATTPALWHGLAIYAIGMLQNTNDVRFNARSPGLGAVPVALTGKGSDEAVFIKLAMPLGKGFSVGGLLSHETSQFDAATTASQSVHYETKWRPSGGFGVSWQPDKRMLFGFRGLLNNDLERRTDPAGTSEGMARSAEFRLGGAFLPWQGAQVDVGGTRLERRNSLAGTHTLVYHPNLGFEQALLKSRLTLRAGLDETSPTAGLSLKVTRFKLDTAYVENMGRSRVGNLFGTHSNSVLFTFTVDYGRAKRPQLQTPRQPDSPTPRSANTPTPPFSRLERL